jgi:hypothetical protein
MLITSNRASSIGKNAVSLKPLVLGDDDRPQRDLADAFERSRNQFKLLMPSAVS